jgi:hypothetical protein
MIGSILVVDGGLTSKCYLVTVRPVCRASLTYAGYSRSGARSDAMVEVARILKRVLCSFVPERPSQFNSGATNVICDFTVSQKVSTMVLSRTLVTDDLTDAVTLQTVSITLPGLIQVRRP